MITIKDQTDMDRFIISRIIDPSAPKIEFKNITFNCKMIKDASGNVFVKLDRPLESDYCPNCGAKIFKGGDSE